MKSLRGIAIRTIFWAGLASAAGAADGPPADGQQTHRGPPPEALAACKTLASGAACSFTSPRGSVTGTCWAPEGKLLACRPKNAPVPGGPPPQGSTPTSQ